MKTSGKPILEILLYMGLVALMMHMAMQPRNGKPNDKLARIKAMFGSHSSR